jgi:hypothetical protein
MDETEIEIKLRLSEKWKVNQNWGWYPIDRSVNPDPQHIEVFKDRYFEKEADLILREYIEKTLGISEVFVFEEQVGYEKQNIREAELYYTGMEKLITDENATFCLYGSHEASFTVGSEKILAELKRKWPKYGERIYTTPFYE